MDHNDRDESGEAGSVRIPSAFNGIAALKPTAARFSFSWDDGRTVLNSPGDYGVAAAGGPMARRVSDLVEVCKASRGAAATHAS